ncbi:MAG: DNA cytosine methyltransferase [Candidatus Thiodiazotropha lotti]|nr:DNA cytosine methyltransferase [Candidatus Thiodiazotropha lotti]
MNELALFAGNGGGLLAGKILGWRPVCAVEISDHSRAVLVARQNDRALNPFPIWDDIKTFDGRPWRGIVDIISGGFPCQAYSNAASGKNNAEDLWPEMRRVVADAAPRYVFAENVSRKAIDAAADDLEEMGYETTAIPLGAKDLGGDHIRNRYWLLAYADDKSELLRGFNAEVADSEDFSHSVWSPRPWRTRMDDGVASRVERYTGTGNGQIPIVAITALRLMVAT